MLLACPAYDTISAHTAVFLQEMGLYCTQAREDIGVMASVRSGFPVAGCKHCYEDGKEMDDTRNWLCQRALDQGVTHLCMVDDDMARPDAPGTYTMLAALLDCGVDVVAPLFIRRSTPYDFLARHYDKESDTASPISVQEASSGKLMEVSEVGSGMIVISTHALRQINPPWFCFEQRGKRWLPEDVNFCRKARANGIRIWVHTGIHLDHIGYHRYRAIEGIAFQEASINKMAQEVSDGMHQEAFKQMRELV